MTRINTGTNLGNGPMGIALGKDGKPYVAELGKRAVIRVDPASGAEDVVSQGGHFIGSSGIAASRDGHLLVVDHGADKVVHVDTIAGHQQLISSGG